MYTVLYRLRYLKISGTGTDVADKMVSDLAASDDADDPNYTPPLDLDFSSENGDPFEFEATVPKRVCSVRTTQRDTPHGTLLG